MMVPSISFGTTYPRMRPSCAALLSTLTHVSADNMPRMVNVEGKKMTRRVARAQSRLVLPPQVVAALHATASGDIAGPKVACLPTAIVSVVAPRTPLHRSNA